MSGRLRGSVLLPDHKPQLNLVSGLGSQKGDGQVYCIKYCSVETMSATFCVSVDVLLGTCPDKCYIMLLLLYQMTPSYLISLRGNSGSAVQYPVISHNTNSATILDLFEYQYSPIMITTPRLS